MSLNFNVGPYFDDFDPSKNFHRILFKPGSAVQARELTQSQTILQNQISNFASAIFSQNTPVSGGQVTINQKCYYLKLNNTYNSVTVLAENFNNQIIQDTSGTILARVIAVAESTISGSNAGDPPTLIVTYLSGAQFKDGDVISTTTGTTYLASVATSIIGNISTGLSSTASIDTGVFYVVNGYSISDITGIKYSIGNFVQVDPQTIILDKYDNTPSYRVGLQITETIYDYINDSSLLDPAIGASNYQAPGADRYVITLTLVTLPLTLGNDDNFIELVRIENGNILKQVDGTVYSTIDDYFAKRDYETNGDYIVNDFKLTPSANSISNTTYDLNISKGIAYVHGYRVENQSDIKLTNNRAQAVANISNNPVFVDYGNYFVVDTSNGVFDISTMPSVDLHCVPASNIVSTNNITYSSTLVGSAFIRNLTYVSGTGSTTQNYVYNAYVSDFSANTLSGNVTSGTASTFTITDTNGSFSATSNAYFGVTVSMNTNGINDVRKITNYNGSTKVATVDNPFTVDPTSSSTFSIIFKNNDVESIVKTAGSGSFALTANVNINTAGGKVNGLANSETVLYNQVAPELLFQVGYPYVAQLTTTSYYTQRVYRSKTFTGSTLTLQSTSGNASNPLRFEGSGTLSSSAAEQLFMVIDNSTGRVMDFTTSGNTISISGDKTTATFTVGAGVASNKNVTIIAQVQASSGDSASYVLKSKNLIEGNTTTVGALSSIGGTSVYQDLTKGQIAIAKSGFTSTGKMSLYVNDVKKITKIVDSGVAGTNPTGDISSYTDITSYFTLDNGQRDTHYDHASVSLIPGAPVPTGNILVIVDYYSHTQSSSGDGYFSIQSYNSAGSTYGGVSGASEAYAEIGSYTSQRGTLYNLRDCIDFRPCRKNGQTGYVWEYSGTQSSVNDIGMLIPNNLSNFTSFYQYYLGRKDKLVLTKDNSFNIVQGTPSVNPLLPNEPSGSLVLANLSHDPYTAYVPGEAPAGITPNLSVNKVIHKRWAKEDITDLETRVNNLEYYTSLSILEQKASSLQIPDANGLNRFKNGILVDDFSSFGTADTNNPDFASNINVRKNQLSALQLVDNFQLQNPVVLASLGTIKDTNSYKISNINGAQTNLFTLPYTTENVAYQPLASSTVSVNPFNVTVQEGNLQLNPPIDNWVDNNQAPAVLITDPNFRVYQASGGVNLLNAGDYQTIPGTTLTTSSTRTSVSTNGNDTTTTTTRTTQTYASQIQNTTSGAYNPTSTTFGVNNGYLTNIAVLPYIRPQQVIVRASGLLVNSNVSTFFDGVDVSQYMSSPNTIELTGVSGTFSNDDIVGFYVSNTFYPVARVISVYNYPNTTKSRLYVADIIGAPNTLGTTTLRNATFDTNGNYVSSTASGTVPAGAIVNLNQSGYISGVGGGWSNTLNGGATTQLYGTPVVQNYSTLLNNYGVWGDAKNGTTFNLTSNVTFTTAGTYTIEVGASGSATVYADGTSIGTSLTNTPASTTTFTYSVATAPSTVKIGWAATSSGTTTSAFGMTIKDPTNSIVYTSINPPVTYVNAGTSTVMPMGGEWFKGATQLRLNPATASNTANFYVGSTINITSKYVYKFNTSATYVPPPQLPSGGAGGLTLKNGYRASLYNYTATITAYDIATKLVTLDTPVNLSLGTNTEMGGDISSYYSISGNLTKVNSAVQAGTSLAKPSTDEAGNFVGVFNIPSTKFQTGSRVFRVDNRSVATSPTTATTFAEGTFIASGLSTASQRLDFAPSIDSSKSVFTQVNQRSNQLISYGTTTSTSTVTTEPVAVRGGGRDPVAQTFIVSKDNYPNGVFLYSIKLFFYSKPTTNIPVTLSILPTVNGYPGGAALDYSTVVMQPNEVNTSSTPHYLDPSAYTEFVFDAPVYIQSNVLYAFMVKSTSKDYVLYYGQQNQTAISSTAKAKVSDPNPTNVTKIGAAPYVGALFESQNGMTWTADQTKDLMFVIDKCLFTQTSASVPFTVPKNLPYRKMGSQDILNKIDANSVSQLFGNYSPTRVYDALNITTTDFVPTGTGINYSYSTTLSSGNVPTGLNSITPGKLGSPLPDDIYLNDGNGERTLVKESSNSFSLYASMSTSDPNVTPIISDDGVTMYAVSYVINNMGIGNNVISITDPGYGYNVDSTTITISSPDIGSTSATLGFTANANGAITSVYTITPGSGYITTPTITISDPTTRGGNANVVVTVTGETSPKGGNSYAKYFTKKVVLAPGNDSGDLRVFYTAYKPLGTAVYVYYKILNAADTAPFESGNWQLMTTVQNQNAYSTNRNDLYEFECAPGIFANNQANNSISYTSSTTGQTYNSFNQFAIKIVLATSDNTNVPFLTDIRALALPAGTGI